MATIDPVVLDLSISEGSKFGPMYNTVVIDPSNSGNEQRIQRYIYPRHKGDLAYGVRTPAQMQSLLSFFHARQGMTRGFLFWDNRDNSASGEQLAVAATLLIAPGDGSNKNFQLMRSYTSGGNTQVRKITRPVADFTFIEPKRAPNVPPQIYLNEVQSLTMAGSPTGGTFALTFGAQTVNVPFNASAATVQSNLNSMTNGFKVVCYGGPLPGLAVTISFVGPPGSQALVTTNSAGLTGGSSPSASVTRVNAGALKTVSTDYTLVTTTGAVTFTTAPAANQLACWTGSFLVPVRFDTDWASWDVKNVMGGWESINIIEVRE